MGKVSIFIYITIGLQLLIFLSRSPKKTHNHHRHMLKVRSSFNFNPTSHEPVPFEPLVAGIERRREEKEWEKQYMEHAHPELVSHHAAPGEESQTEWEDFMNAEDYLNDEENFNVTNRLVVLFPKIDVNPADGYISESELTEWNMQQSERKLMHRTQREMEIHDKNKDGFVSFAEYEPPSWVRNSDNNSFGYDMGWWKEEHFNASDADGDGTLNIKEFNDFLHPANSKNPKLLLRLCKEEVKERDTDRDGKVNFKEFFHGLFNLVRNYADEVHQLFAQLVKDGDRYLSHEELLPVMGKLHPSERDYARQQADYFMSQADADKDGRLTLIEIINNPYVF